MMKVSLFFPSSKLQESELGKNLIKAEATQKQEKSLVFSTPPKPSPTPSALTESFLSRHV
jgi:hypothetical protein